MPGGCVLASLDAHINDGKNNDSVLTCYIIERNQQFRFFRMKKLSVYSVEVLRDVLDDFKTIGYEYQMPAVLKKEEIGILWKWQMIRDW